MERSTFYSLCERLRACEYQLVLLEKPERGVKAKAKKTREALRGILTPQQLARLTREARNFNAIHYSLVNTDDETFTQRHLDDAQRSWRQLTPHLYSASIYNA
jgi:hypothetical protein